MGEEDLKLTKTELEELDALPDKTPADELDNAIQDAEKEEDEFAIEYNSNHDEESKDDGQVETTGLGDSSDGMDDLFGTDEATAKVLSKLVDKNQINMFTILDREIIASLTIGKMVGLRAKEKVGSTLMIDMVQEFKELQVSEDGTGRKQVVGMGSMFGGQSNEKKGLLGSLFNR